MKQLVQVLLLGFLVVILGGCPGGSSDSDDGPNISGLNSGNTTGGGNNTATPGSTGSFAGVGAITFTSATPETIGIRGTDVIATQSIITFTVTDANGDPVVGQPVDFSLNTSVGGITLSHSQRITDENGLAVVTVSSGDVSTSARVTATSTMNGATASAQSSQLVITTGIADQDSFSVSISDFNIEGSYYDGEETTITLRAADRYNNPVADNTAIYFTTEGGSIPGSCFTVDGACEVKLTSQQPRPLDGRVTVLVSAIGEESFLDTTPSNGRYDDAETFSDTSREAFRDDNFNGSRDPNEIYIDFNSNNAYDLVDGQYNGLLCNGPAKCSSTKTTQVFRNIEIIFSDSFFDITATPSAIALTTGGPPVSVVVDVKGANNGQVPPVGTKINATTTFGTLEDPKSYEMLNTTFNPATGSAASDPSRFTFQVAPAGAAGSGVLTIEVETPKGNKSALNIPITQS